MVHIAIDRMIAECSSPYTLMPINTGDGSSIQPYVMII